jgi:putative PIN family toxin of toxin-antitoxin system
MAKPRIVLDTNVLISRLLKPTATLASIVIKASSEGTIITSQATFDELAEVIRRFVARGYITDKEAVEYLAAYKMRTEWIPILEHIKACRDPKDDKFLELAVNGNASYLVTGDKDLLVLNPFRDISIITPAQFLNAMNP